MKSRTLSIWASFVAAAALAASLVLQRPELPQHPGVVILLNWVAFLAVAITVGFQLIEWPAHMIKAKPFSVIVKVSPEIVASFETREDRERYLAWLQTLYDKNSKSDI